MTVELLSPSKRAHPHCCSFGLWPRVELQLGRGDPRGGQGVYPISSTLCRPESRTRAVRLCDPEPGVSCSGPPGPSLPFRCRPLPGLKAEPRGLLGRAAALPKNRAPGEQRERAVPCHDACHTSECLGRGDGGRGAGPPCRAWGRAGSGGGFYGAAAGGGWGGKGREMARSGLQRLSAAFCPLPPAEPGAVGGTARDPIPCNSGAAGGCHLRDGSEPPFTARPLGTGLGAWGTGGDGHGAPHSLPHGSRGGSRPPAPLLGKGQAFARVCSVIGVACCFRAAARGR